VWCCLGMQLFMVGIFDLKLYIFYIPIGFIYSVRMLYITFKRELNST